MGVNPLHFANAQTPGLNPNIYPVVGCSKEWHKYDWQSFDAISLWQVSQHIYEAELEIANVMGFWPAPYWTENEIHPYPQPYNRELFGTGLNVRGEYKSISTNYGKIINPGARAVSLIDTATTTGGSLVYSDEDSDGFYDTATITLPTTLTDVKEIKVFFNGVDGALEWEIRPARSKVISGGNVQLIFDSWLFIQPDLYELPPTTDEVESIDVSTVANFVSDVDVYREYIDTTVESASFFWTPDRMVANNIACPNCGIINCATCSYDEQGGCSLPRDHASGDLAVYPATYNASDGIWARQAWAYCIEPTMVRVDYLSGDQSQEYLQGRNTEPLSDAWAQAIAWIATARFERPVCDCGNLRSLAEELSIDITHATTGDSHFVVQDVMNCPFGTKKGEVMAWRKIKHTSPQKRLQVALI
jgi:hypothetical protein